MQIIGLTPNTTYRVQVRAQDGGKSPWSDSTPVTTQMAVANPTALLSNFDEGINTVRADLAADDGKPGSTDWSQDFWTGPSPYGYTLSTIELDFETPPSDDVEVIVRPRTDIGMRPVRATLVNPATLVRGINTFTAPGDTRLAPNTRYYVIVSATSGQLRTKAKVGGFPGCAPPQAPCLGPTRFHFADGRTDREFINPQVSPHAPLAIRVNGIATQLPAGAESLGLERRARAQTVRRYYVWQYHATLLCGIHHRFRMRVATS